MVSLEAELERARRLMEKASPEALEQSAAILERVAAFLSSIRQGQAASITFDEARRIQLQAREARLLLDSAARFHSRWQTILSGMTAGYNAAGVSAPLLSARGRLRISG